MRQILIAVGIYAVLNLFLPTIWEKVMSNAPDWALPWILFGSTVICLGIVAFSDPVYSRLTNPASFPVTSTLAFSGLVVALAASGWWFFVALPGSQPRLRLEWHPTPDELGIAIMVETHHTLRDVWVEVIDIRKRSSSGDFVEVPELHGAGEFEKFSISAGILSDVYPERPLVLRFVGVRDLTGEQLQRPVIWRVVARSGEDVLSALQIPSPGVWRVSFGEANVAATQRTRHLYFEWIEGKPLAPWEPN